MKGKKKGRPKKRWLEVIREDMRKKGFQKELAEKRQEYKGDCTQRPTPASR